MWPCTSTMKTVRSRTLASRKRPSKMIDRNDRREHSGELAFSKQRHGDDQRGAVVLAYAEWLADVVEALNAGGEGALERHCDEGISVGAETSGGFAFRLRVDGGDVENVRIILDEILQQARHLRSVRGIVNILNPAG